MVEAKLDGDGSLSDATEQGATAAAEPIDSGGDDRSAVIATVATVAVVGIGAAAFSRHGGRRSLTITSWPAACAATTAPRRARSSAISSTCQCVSAAGRHDDHSVLERLAGVERLAHADR
jgi:hypothetical protein